MDCFYGKSITNMDYKEVNRKAWNDRTDVHIDSDFYEVEAF